VGDAAGRDRMAQELDGWFVEFALLCVGSQTGCPQPLKCLLQVLAVVVITLAEHQDVIQVG